MKSRRGWRLRAVVGLATFGVAFLALNPVVVMPLGRRRRTAIV